MAKILIIEDERVLNEAYQTILQQHKHEVFSAFDGEEAIKITKDLEPDVILLDLRMPKMNGIEFLKVYDQPNKHPKVKIVIFSNLDMQKEIDEAYKYGAGRYMLKAWASPKELVKLIADTLNEKS